MRGAHSCFSFFSDIMKHMQFIVPQFIDIEDKVIGPLTFKQFMYLAGGAGLAFAVYKLVPPIISIPIALAFVTLAFSLTFVKVNGKPFVFVLQAFISYFFQSKLYIWKKIPKKEEQQEIVSQEPQEKADFSIPRLTESRLGDLSWSLDILDVKEKNQ